MLVSTSGHGNGSSDLLIELLKKLQRAVMLITNFSLSPAEAKFFKTIYSTTSLYPISFHSVKEIWKFKQLVKTFSDAQNNLLNIIQNPGTNNWQSKLTKLTGWNSDDITTITGSSYLGITSPSIKSIDLLYEYFSIASLLGIKVTAVWELSQIASLVTSTISITLTNGAFTSLKINGQTQNQITSGNINTHAIVNPIGLPAFSLAGNYTSANLQGSLLIIENPSGGVNLVEGFVSLVAPSTNGDLITYTLYSFSASANDLWGGLQAQLKDSPATLTKIQNRLNEKLRDKLVPLAIYNLSSSIATWTSNYGNAARDLYAYLLIDVEVTGAIQTTYIREAISAVQLYINRCLNQLEPCTTVSGQLPTLWQWMQSYREWQANMEVFLYPENYIEPELRVEKTDLFTKAEHALKQADLTNPESVETIFREYMNGFEEIGNLQVISCAAHTYQKTDAEGTQNFKELCMIGVGPSGHGQYYYRISKFRESALQNQYVPYDWGQWKKIKITMNTVEYQTGQYGIPKPVFAFGRWYIFWVEQQMYNSINDNSASTPTTYKYYSGTVNLTYLDFNGNWTPPQTILKTDLDQTLITQVTVTIATPSATTTSYIISNEQDAEVRFAPFESGSSIFFFAFKTFCTYTPSEIPNIILGEIGFQCIKYSRSVVNVGTTYGLFAVSKTICVAAGQLLDVLCFGPEGTDFWFAGTSSGLYYFNSNPTAWEQEQGIPLDVRIQDICTDKNGNWLVGTSSGAYYGVTQENNTISWTLVTKTIPITADVLCVCYDGVSYWYAGTDNGLYSYTSLSKDWSLVNGVPEINVTCLVSNGDSITYAGTPLGLFTNSASENGSWYQVTFTFVGTNFYTQSLNIQCLIYSDKDDLYLAGTSSGLYYLAGKTLGVFTGSAKTDYWYRLGSTASSIPDDVNVQTLCTDNKSNYLIGTSKGLYSIKNDNDNNLVNTVIPATCNVQVVYNCTQTSNWYAATSNGLYTTTSAKFPVGWSIVPIEYAPPPFAVKPITVFPGLSGLSDFIQIQNESNWFVVNGQNDQYLNISYPPGNAPTNFNVYRLNSTAIPVLGALLNEPNGINKLLTTSAQQTSEALFANLEPVSTYIPTTNYPLDVIDFSNKSALRMYYWELFFHLPFLVANKLNQQQHFAHAKSWYEYVFNPLITTLSDQTNNKYWRFLGLRTDGNNPNQTLANELAECEMVELRKDLHNAVQLYASEFKPFDPQAIAQLRPIAYQKTIVMHYINNLLAWGDMLYTENTRDSINEAEMLYVLAYNLLGTQPQDLGPERLQKTTSYGLLRQNWMQYSSNEFLETATVTSIYQAGNSIYVETNGQGLWSSDNNGSFSQVKGIVNTANVTSIFSYGGNIYVGTGGQGLWILLPNFGIPRNQQFLNYWTEVKQRIYNIRHGLTLTGQVDNLPLFSPPINPMDLVDAIGSGESVEQAIQLFNGNVPYYRFEAMIEKAKEFNGTVIQFGQSLLAALQTKDSEKLAELYNKNERHILNLTQASKQDNLQYAQQTLASLQQAHIDAQNRHAHYNNLINAGWLPGETAQVALSGAAITVQIPAEAIRIESIVGYSIPTIFGFSDGGFHPGDAIKEGAEMLNGISGILDQSANLAGVISGFQRRAQDWQLQAQLAQDDINQIKYQILASHYQMDMAQQDITILQKQIAQQQKVAEFYKTKFTNEQLYSWYIGRLSALYFQTYQLAHDMALQAENAWKFEHIGLPFSNQKDNFIQSGYWNSLYEGLLAGESLQLDLLRMEKTYMNQNVRRFEITKTISLAQLDPAALYNLITAGSCRFDVTENNYAWDYPGHYCRKIKSISISIPMVVGPYQNIHATLTQTASRVINADDSNGQNAVQHLLNGETLNSGNTSLQANLIPNQQIALSQGVNDTGMFELNFNDARYLPFEGTGAVSSWQLDLPIAENSINYNSITDVIVQINYTALQASSSYEKTVKTARGNFEEYFAVSLAQECMTEWNAFIANSALGLNFSINTAKWKRVSGNSTVTILSMLVILQSANSASGLTLEISDPSVGKIQFSQWQSNQSAGSSTDFVLPPQKQNLNLTVNGSLPSELQNIILIVQYQVSN